MCLVCTYGVSSGNAQPQSHQPDAGEKPEDRFEPNPEHPAYAAEIDDPGAAQRLLDRATEQFEKAAAISYQAESSVRTYPDDPAHGGVIARQKFWGGDGCFRFHQPSRVVVFDGSKLSVVMLERRTCTTVKGQAVDYLENAILAIDPQLTLPWFIEWASAQAEQPFDTMTFNLMTPLGTRDEVIEGRSGTWAYFGLLTSSHGSVATRLWFDEESGLPMIWETDVSYAYKAFIEESITGHDIEAVVTRLELTEIETHDEPLPDSIYTLETGSLMQMSKEPIGP